MNDQNSYYELFKSSWESNPRFKDLKTVITFKKKLLWRNRKKRITPFPFSASHSVFQNNNSERAWSKIEHLFKKIFLKQWSSIFNFLKILDGVLFLLVMIYFFQPIENYFADKKIICWPEWKKNDLIFCQIWKQKLFANSVDWLLVFIFAWGTVLLGNIFFSNHVG